MKFLRSLPTIVAFLLSPVLAQANIMIRTEALKDATVFIYPPNASGSVDPTAPLGTGFLLGIPLKGTDQFYPTLVTARHVLNPSWAGCTGPNPQRVFLRVNLKNYDSSKLDSGVSFIPIDLIDKTGAASYSVSRDPQIDAAVVLLNANTFSNERFASVPIAFRNIATSEEIGKLETGDAIVSAGLVPGTQGARRNYPVFKFGALSTKVDEPFFTGCGQGTANVPESIWFISINLFPGASGSAVFYTPPESSAMLSTAIITRPILIGVQSSSLLNADVAAMTPIEPVVRICEDMHLPNADLYRGPVVKQDGKPK